MSYNGRQVHNIQECMYLKDTIVIKQTYYIPLEIDIYWRKSVRFHYAPTPLGEYVDRYAQNVIKNDIDSYIYDNPRTKIVFSYDEYELPYNEFDAFIRYFEKYSTENNLRVVQDNGVYFIRIEPLIYTHANPKIRSDVPKDQIVMNRRNAWVYSKPLSNREKRDIERLEGVVEKDRSFQDNVK